MSALPVAERILALLTSHQWALRALLALVLVVVGVWFARRLSRVLDRLLVRLKVDDILRSFLRNLAYSIAVVVVVIAALDYTGFPTTSLLAVVGAAGLAVGLALKDSLANIASGGMLMLLRPFHAGDFVQIAGLEGSVDSVRIFQTRLHTADNRLIILPNSQITTAPIVNYTARGERRIDVEIGIGYEDDVVAARHLLVALAVANPRVKRAPAPQARLQSLGDSRVMLQLRAWAVAADYGDVRGELLESILIAFREQGFHLPVPRGASAPVHAPKPEPVSAPAAGGGLQDSLLPPA